MPPRKKAPGNGSGTSGTLMKPPTKGVKVRMYRTGLGDCFLLAFPRRAKGNVPRDKVFYMLIDCGVYYSTESGGERMKKIVGHIRDSTAGRLDLLVITHEHWDHVSAFHPQQAQALFRDEIEIRRLWLAWTENLDLPLARELDSNRKTMRLALLEALNRIEPLELKSQDHLLIEGLLGFFGVPVEKAAAASPGSGPAPAGTPFAAAKKSVMTEEVMEWLRLVYGKDRTQFLHPGEEPLTFDGVSDARVYVLGPPEDRELIRRSDPLGNEVYPKGMAAAIESSFFATFGVVPEQGDGRAGEEDIKEAQRLCLPFDGELQVRRGDVEKALKGETLPKPVPEQEFFRDHYLEKEKWRQIDGDWLDAASGFALQLDSATNNTSLAFALEIGPCGKGKVLLFPGDAQVGNCLSWFGKVKLKSGSKEREAGKNMEWSAEDGKITAEGLLRRTVFYKVGHHGSHNATLRQQGLELMGSPDLVAFLPVDEHVARKLAHYGEMPLRSLIKELAIRTKGRVARNDEGAKPEEPLSTLAPIPDAPALSSDFVDATSTDLYFEYTVSP